MTWQAITEEESVPVVKAGDALVSNFSKFRFVINFVSSSCQKWSNLLMIVMFPVDGRCVYGI
jgi:hypothetical protein